MAEWKGSARMQLEVFKPKKLYIPSSAVDALEARCLSGDPRDSYPMAGLTDRLRQSARRPAPQFAPRSSHGAAASIIAPEHIFGKIREATQLLRGLSGRHPRWPARCRFGA